MLENLLQANGIEAEDMEPRDRMTAAENRIEAMDNADTGELAEIRAALVELADIVMGG